MFKPRVKRVDPIAGLYAVLALAFGCAAVASFGFGEPGTAISFGLGGLFFAVLGLFVQVTQ